jgi:iclR helix-turn-helix domain|nr:MAG TPA: Putative TetR-family transcriptional regulator [Caudoviricetes sp.]
MTTNTASDVRAWYGDFADELTEEQIDSIASAWSTIREITAAFYEDGDADDLASLVEDPDIVAAQIIDGTATLEEMVDREKRAARALASARTATAAAMIASAAAGMDVAEIARRAEMSRTTVYKRLDTLALEA